MFVSIHDSARYSYFSPRAPGNTVAVRELHHAVDDTLDAKSFIVHERGGVISYQAPNRTEQGGVGGIGGDDVIGAKTYWRLEIDNGVVRQWGEEPLTSLINELVGPKAVKATLRDLRRQDSVTKTGGTFNVVQVIPAAKLVPDCAGQFLIRWTVSIRGAYVRVVKGRVFGILPSYFVSGNRSSSSRSFSAVRISFSDIDNVAPIVAPPKAKTVTLVPCPIPTQFIEGSSTYTCGTFLS